MMHLRALLFLIDDFAFDDIFNQRLDFNSDGIYLKHINITISSFVTRISSIQIMQQGGGPEHGLHRCWWKFISTI